jgi:hypothetical protein
VGLNKEIARIGYIQPKFNKGCNANANANAHNLALGYCTMREKRK